MWDALTQGDAYQCQITKKLNWLMIEVRVGRGSTGGPTIGGLSRLLRNRHRVIQESKEGEKEDQEGVEKNGGDEEVEKEGEEEEEVNKEPVPKKAWFEKGKEREE
ncbi:hypothetical protein LENED_008961 [Lentinula edodes]|uniref:Uncharacterized protein n=1 Tax=Lentinula edodes TaxID=5353 RepID=A0A1Q3EII9_LENED|nr:hypothetical protein LENED_008961 [Lentinula edodes]